MVKTEVGPTNIKIHLRYNIPFQSHLLCKKMNDNNKF